MNPRSHLRLVYEANPLSFIAEQVSIAHTWLSCFCNLRWRGMHSLPRVGYMAVSAVSLLIWCGFCM